MENMDAADYLFARPVKGVSTMWSGPKYCGTDSSKRRIDADHKLGTNVLLINLVSC